MLLGMAADLWSVLGISPSIITMYGFVDGWKLLQEFNLVCPMCGTLKVIAGLGYGLFIPAHATDHLCSSKYALAGQL